MLGSIINILLSDFINHSVKDLHNLLTVVTLAQQGESKKSEV
jgi:hypothetical protein